jgi:hypothetical protein
MPERETIARARKKKRAGKAASTQAGEFVREEMEHAREGTHPVKGRKQAIAIGLSKARRAGVNVPPPPKRRQQEGRRKAPEGGQAPRNVSRGQKKAPGRGATGTGKGSARGKGKSR